MIVGNGGFVVCQGKGKFTSSEQPNYSFIQTERTNVVSEKTILVLI